MAMAGAVPAIVVLALGAGALGGPDALRLLVELAGQNPVVDIGICVFVFAVVTAQLLGGVLLVRFVRNRNAPAAGDGAGRGAPATTDCLARVTLLLSLAAALLVTACLLVVSGGPGSVCVLVDFAAEYYPIAITATAACASLPYAMPLLRVFRERRNARGAAPAGRHPALFVGLPLVAAVCAVVVATPSGARVGLDALRRSPAFTITSVAVAVAVGATLLVRFYRRVRA